jgi:hypothetical protein
MDGKTLIMLLTAGLLLLVQAIVLPAIAQTTICGTVRYAQSCETVAGANVIFQTPDGMTLYGFDITGADGEFLFKSNDIQADSVKIMVTGFNMKKTVRIISLPTETLDFQVEFEETTLKEAMVRAEPVRRRSDTLSYIVNAYADSLVDRSIGDVMKKMPGIDVSASGQIRYNNRPINKFYIEGLDLMGGRYGVAVNNVRAKDIVRVEVMENHQPIRAMEGLEYSPDAAINLRLKNSAKGSLISTIQLGTGYKPWLWNGELAMMYFTGKWQTMTTYKTNNAGQDVTSELESLYDRLEEEYSSLSVHKPATPDTDRERYMDNETHAVSVSNIFKLSEDSDHTLNLNVMYLRDRQRFNSNSLTTYYLPGGSPLEIDEVTSATETTDETEFKVKYNRNDKNVYLSEQLSFGAKWDDNFGTVINDTETVDQRFCMRQLRSQNDLRFTKVLNGDIRLNFTSRIYASELPSNLRVNPVLYPEIFGYDAHEALQEMSNRKLSTNNNVFVIKTFPKAGIDLHASIGFSADLQEMTSSLYEPAPASADGKTVPDSLRNDTDCHRFDVRVNLGMTYRLPNFSISTGISPIYSNVSSNDLISRYDRHRDKVFINPHIGLDWEITPNLSFLASGSLIGNIGAASNIYSGYIMTDYRQIGSRDGKIAEGLYQNYSAELRYADALLSLFGSVKVDYRRNDSNLMYGTEYFGSLSRVQTYDIDNTSQGWGIEGRIEKRFNAISTTVGIPVGYRRNLMDVLRQGIIMNTATWSLPVGLEVSSRLATNAFLEYEAKYVRSGSKIFGGDGNEGMQSLKAINALHQRLGFNFVFFKRLTFNVCGDHYFNDAISSGSRNMFFLDASLKLKAKKFEYILEGRNLLNNSFYNQRMWSDITNYQYNYLLRPVSVMFKIRFSLGS